MRDKKAWFVVLVAVCVAAMFLIPGVALGKNDNGGGGGGSTGTEKCPPSSPRGGGNPEDPARKCGHRDATTTDGTTTDGTTTDGTTTDGTTTDGVTNECLPDTIAIVEGDELVRVHLEPSDDSHSDGIVGAAHACVTIGAPPAPPPAAPCPGPAGQIPGVLEVRGDPNAQVLQICAHV